MHAAHISGAARTTPMQRNGTRLVPLISRHWVVPCVSANRAIRSWPASTTTGSPSSDSSRPCSRPSCTKGAVNPPHSPPVLPMPPGNPAVSRTGHRSDEPEASSSVFITVGAQ